MSDINNINYKRLLQALEYYQEEGYTYVDLEWTVDDWVSDITKPVENKNFYVNDKVMVASAEQVYLQMLIKNELPNGKYVGITPCFRDEKLDFLHKNYFMKVELINTLNTSIENLKAMLDDAMYFYEKYLRVRIDKIDDVTYDLVDVTNGIELGSYGIREFGEHRWIYGTGLAEPRFSRVVDLQ